VRKNDENERLARGSRVTIIAPIHSNIGCFEYALAPVDRLIRTPVRICPAMPAPEKSKSLESWIWDAACSIRGAKDAPKYKDYILPLIFTKRLCDVFDDELNRIAKEVGSRKKAFQLVKADHKLVRFYLPLVPDDPEQPVWSVIRKLSDKIGEGVTTQMRAIARENPLLQGIIDRVDFNATTHGQRDLDDDRLSNLIEVISTKRLGLDDVEADIIDKSYESCGARKSKRSEDSPAPMHQENPGQTAERSPKGERGGARQYLIRKFAEGGGQSVGEAKRNLDIQPAFVRRTQGPIFVAIANGADCYPARRVATLATS
jgi:type I restriction-modification system DNA methylase subunit